MNADVFSAVGREKGQPEIHLCFPVGESMVRSSEAAKVAGIELRINVIIY